MLKIVPILFVVFGISCGKESKSPDLPQKSADQGEEAPPVADQPSAPPPITLDPIEPPAKEEEQPLEEVVAPELVPVLEAASAGPILRGVELYGEKWNINKAEVVKEGSKLIVTGRIAHHIPAAPGDQVDYKFVFEDGKISNQEIKIEAGGYLRYVRPALNIINEFTATPIPVETIYQVIERIQDQLLDDKWETSVHGITSAIALHLYKQAEDQQ